LCTCFVITTAIQPSITISYWTLPQFHWQSLWTTEFYHTLTVNHYKLLNTHIIQRAIIINYWTLPQFYRACSVVYDCWWDYGSVQWYIMNNGGFLCMFRSWYWLLVKLCACLVVHCDCRWNCCRLLNTHTISPTITINYWTRTQFHWQSL
jgi:hypothetical protein